MGADFMVTLCRFPHKEEKANYLSEGPELASLMKERAANISERTLKGLMEYMGIDFEVTNTPEAECRQQLAEYIDEIFGTGYRRDVTVVMLDGTQWLVSGGMSFGDPPTYAYDALVCLDISGITEEPIA